MRDMKTTVQMKTPTDAQMLAALTPGAISYTGVTFSDDWTTEEPTRPDCQVARR